MKLKESIHRFREWQKRPFQYSSRELTDQTCACCGHEYKGNYCPVCGQKSGDGRITWDWVRRSVMLLWGMESHSMFVSLWQLLLRPGYFIKDYLNGRRQVSYPPVKMLFVVSLIYLIFRQLLDMLFPGAPVVESVPEDLSESVIETAHTWITENPGYGMMTMTLILILPTWFFFRYAPRHPRHTFPEGFFIQIFMSSLMILIIFINRVTDKWFFWLVPLYYFIAYRQLFGYGIWATIWRLLLSFVFWMVSVFFFVFAYILVKTDDFWQALAAMLSVLGILLAILVLGYLFEHRNRRNLPFKQDR